MCIGGSGSSSQSSSDDTTGVTTIPGATPEENRLLAQFGSLNSQQVSAIQAELQRWSDPNSVPLGLSPADTATYNQSYDPAIALRQAQSKEELDRMAGSRGLRMSDTPIAEPGLRTANTDMGRLLGEKAQGQLNFGLRSAQQRINSTLGLGSSTPGAGVFNLSQYLQERAAQPTTDTTGTSSMSGSRTPSGMEVASQVSAGVGAAATAVAAGFAI